MRLRRFFHRAPGGYQISKSIRDMCVFARQNVFSDPPFSRMDLISCRNVLIYLSAVLQKKVIPIFHYALKENGFLLVGNSEGLLGAGAEIFTLVDRKNKIYQKKTVPSPVTFGMTIGEAAEKAEEKPVHAEREDEPNKPPVDVQREADRLLLSKYVPSAVVVTEDLDIVQSRGKTSRFLELPSGRASLNLLKMARPGLLYELRTLLEKVRKNSAPAIKEGIVLEDGDENVEVKLEVIPFRTPVRDQRHFLVLFEESPSPMAEPKPSARQSARKNADAKDVQIARLRQELASTKEYLQSIIEAQEASNEELQSANEEIQSGNEELQSTNEELQTSKEELESANEELNTVNEEIQHRNQELAQFSNDLINLLNSATIPMIMVGQDLHIRRYTPEAERVFGFTSHDVGKALSHLPLNIQMPQLERWMLDVMRDVSIRNEQVRARDGKAYKLRLTPYRTLENKIDGVVIALLDISDLVGPLGRKTRWPYRLEAVSFPSLGGLAGDKVTRSGERQLAFRCPALAANASSVRPVGFSRAGNGESGMQLAPSIPVELVAKIQNALPEHEERTVKFGAQRQHFFAQPAHFLDAVFYCFRGGMGVGGQPGQVKCLADGTGANPGIKFRLGGHDGTARLAGWAAHRQTHLPFVALHRANPLTQVARNFFPSAEELGRV